MVHSACVLRSNETESDHLNHLRKHKRVRSNSLDSQKNDQKESSCDQTKEQLSQGSDEL